MTEPEDLAPHESAEILHNFFNRNRSRLVVQIDLDPVPGWGNDPDDHRALVQRLLDAAVPHYKPTVEVAPLASGVLVEPSTLADDETLVEAWEEGYEAGVSDTVARSAPPGPNGPIDPTVNPYLAAALAGGGAA